MKEETELAGAVSLECANPECPSAPGHQSRVRRVILSGLVHMHPRREFLKKLLPKEVAMDGRLQKSKYSSH